MLSTLRRGPASLQHLLRYASQAPSAGRSSCRRIDALQITRPNIVIPHIRAFTYSARWRQEAAAAASQIESSDPLLEFQELESRGLVHSSVIQTIVKDMGLSRMTDVQTATINEALAGDDIVAQAKTGTGKTIAFLLPILQKIIAEDPTLATRGPRRRTTPDDIRAIIISPTRELAEQIAVEARRITKNTGVIVQSAVGGTQKSAMLAQTQREGCHILVGTPGRLADLLQDPYSEIRAPKLSVFVLDEADRLLDDGFWPEIKNIESLLPDREANNIQTMMFSATIPPDVVSAVRSILKPGFRFVKCVRDDEEPTHERVPQKVVRTLGLENNLPALVELCLRELDNSKEDPSSMPFKAIVYFNSTAMVQLAEGVLQNLGNRRGPSPLGPARVFGIHSKLGQGQRTRASDGFRRSTSGILLSSDVTARGMDFPNVTHVIQIGPPQTADAYIHRIGRTGRAGKPGTGYLFVTPIEEAVTRQRLGSLPLQKDESLAAASVDMTQAGQIPARVASILTTLSDAHRGVPRDVMSAAYRSLIGIFGYVNDKERVVEAMNTYARFGWGLSQPPALSAMLVQKLGLSRVPGIVTDNGMARGRGAGDYQRGGMGSRMGRGRDSRSSGGAQGDAFDQAFEGERDFGRQRDSGRQRNSGGFQSRQRQQPRW
ncbi:DEAD-domain-containing protein [Rhizodiscina lignyota]|uniref:ATP-dependent RNA helicase n=1 Tax=Rhizodiscina lignyota TaxID=1504668 RepID=A0A9P4IJG9_9PEZI|nr:DEAD-domain-containing protein [Rhizodiscina lignyota]